MYKKSALLPPQLICNTTNDSLIEFFAVHTVSIAMKLSKLHIFETLTSIEYRHLRYWGLPEPPVLNTFCGRIVLRSLRLCQKILTNEKRFEMHCSFIIIQFSKYLFLFPAQFLSQKLEPIIVMGYTRAQPSFLYTNVHIV